MKKNPVQLIKEGDRYFATFSKNGNFIKYEIFPTKKQNSDRIEVNGKIHNIKPLANITKFEVFCIETDLIK